MNYARSGDYQSGRRGQARYQSKSKISKPNTKMRSQSGHAVDPGHKIQDEQKKAGEFWPKVQITESSLGIISTGIKMERLISHSLSDITENKS